ncbi:hypothetical protein SANTM175S_06950 [Streptomyces antimycoticus]
MSHSPRTTRPSESGGSPSRSSTRTPGWAAASRAMASGMRVALALGKAQTRTRPERSRVMALICCWAVEMLVRMVSA